MEIEEHERPKRRMRSKAERRGIVEETYQAGASVARVARRHGVNANQVFRWRRQYREGKLEVDPALPALVPVQVTAALTGRRESKPPASGSITGTIDIELGHARVRVVGRADADCVRAALEGLAR